MSYDPQTWQDLPSTTTPLSAARLAHMESGIQGAQADATAAGTAAATAQTLATAALPAPAAKPAWVPIPNPPYADGYTQWVDEVAVAAVGTNIYVIGGYGNTLLSDVWRFDTTNESWVQMANLPEPMENVGAVTVSGKIYVVGGDVNTGDGYNRNTYEYNPSTNTWATKTACPRAHDSAVAVAFQGKVWLIGGFASTGYTALVDTYDPVGNSWTAGPPLPIATANAAAAVGVWGLAPSVFIADTVQRIHVIGGRTANGLSSRRYKLNDAHDDWVEVSSSNGLPYRVGDARAVNLNGNLHVFGGYASPNLTGGTSTYGPALIEYQPDQTPPAYNPFHMQPDAPLDTFRDLFDAVAVGNNIYAFGGPTEEKWTQFGSKRVPAAQVVQVADLLGFNQLYASSFRNVQDMVWDGSSIQLVPRDVWVGVNTNADFAPVLPTLLGSWLGGGSGNAVPQYYKDFQTGLVHIFGFVHGGAADSVIFNITDGTETFAETGTTTVPRRPYNGDRAFVCWGKNGSGVDGVYQVWVRSSGNVQVIGNASGGLWLDGISYPVVA